MLSTAMFGNTARCKGCELLFCCTKHCNEHHRRCELFKAMMSLNAREETNPPLKRRAMKKDVSARKKKRKHDSSGSPFPPSASSHFRLLIPTERKFKKAMRGKFKTIQKVPTLEPLKEEDEGVEQGFNVPKETNDLSETKAATSDAYNDFKVGSLNESPIITLPSVLLEKVEDILVTSSPLSRGAHQLDDIFKTSTPDYVSPSVNKIADQPGKTPVPKVTFGCYAPHLGVNLTASTPKESEQKNDDDGAGYARDTDSMYYEAGRIESPNQVLNQISTTSISGITTKGQPALFTPIDSRVPTRQRFIRSISSSGSSGSSLYYSACSIISPLALNSHPPTPVSNPSLFKSVKDVFRTFVSRLPGTTGSDPQADGAMSSPVVNSPARKRMKKLVESRIQCRPTFKGRYKQPSSYAFNS